MKVQSIDTAREARDVREINELHAVQEKAIDRALRIGELLTYYKGVVGHGNWLPWLEKNVTFSERTARGYMVAYDDSKSATVADLPKTVRQAVKAKKSATTTIIGKATGKQIGGSQKRKLKEAGIDVDAKLEVGSVEAEEVAAKAAVILKAAPQVVQDSTPLSETAQAKFDRLLVAALAKQKAEQEVRYRDDLAAGIKAALPTAIAAIQKKNQEIQRDLNIINRGPGALISKEEFRKLRALHPDQQLDQAKRGELFALIMKLEPWVNAHTNARMK